MMNESWRAKPWLLAMAQRVLVLCSCSAMALASAQVSVSAPWVRPIVQGQQATGAFMTLNTSKALKLMQVNSEWAGVVQLHSMSMQGNVMKMQAVSDITLTPGSPLVLAPGGYHLMLMDLKPGFAQAKSVPLNLVFKDEAGKEVLLRVDAPIQMSAQREAPMHDSGMEHMHMSH